MSNLEKLKQELIDEIKTYQIGMSEALVRKMPELIKCEGFNQKDMEDVSRTVEVFQKELNKRVIMEIMYRMLFK